MFSDIYKKALKFTSDNSPAILTGIGVVGTVSTGLLAIQGTIKADRILRDDAYDTHGNVYFEHDLRDRARLTWKCYIPAASTATVTVAAIVSSNRIGNRRAAALAAAYAVSEKAFVEYKDKVVEHLGKNKEQKVRDDIQQDRVNNTTSQIIVSNESKVLCYDKFSGRYFESSMEELKKAQNDLNYKILNDYYASLGDFYDLIGLDQIAISDELGWNSDELLEIAFSTVFSDDQKPCIAIDFRTSPIRRYHRIH